MEPEPAIFADGVTTLDGGEGTERDPSPSRFGAARRAGDSLPPPPSILRHPDASVASPVATVDTTGRLPLRANGRFHILTRAQQMQADGRQAGRKTALAY